MRAGTTAGDVGCVLEELLFGELMLCRLHPLAWKGVVLFTLKVSLRAGQGAAGAVSAEVACQACVRRAARASGIGSCGCLPCGHAAAVACTVSCSWRSACTHSCPSCTDAACVAQVVSSGFPEWPAVASLARASRGPPSEACVRLCPCLVPDLELQGLLVRHEGRNRTAGRLITSCCDGAAASWRGAIHKELQWELQGETSVRRAMKADQRHGPPSSNCSCGRRSTQHEEVLLRCKPAAVQWMIESPARSCPEFGSSSGPDPPSSQEVRSTTHPLAG